MRTYNNNHSKSQRPKTKKSEKGKDKSTAPSSRRPQDRRANRITETDSTSNPPTER